MRYFRAKRKSKGLAPSILSVTGIVVGVMTLISVISVMNGFQLGFIEDILEISSYHVRIETKSVSLPPPIIREIEKIKGIRALLPFKEAQSMIRGYFSELEVSLIRGVPHNAGDLDPSLREQLNIIDGEFDLNTPGSIVIGSELAHRLGTGVGDPVFLIGMAGPSFATLQPQELEFLVTGIFQSGYYEFDRRMCFIPLRETEKIIPGERNTIYGVKLEDRFNDLPIIERIKSLVKENHIKIVSWREYNASFFGALRMEKLIMMILLALIFLVVAGNIYHSLNRAVYERKEEIGLLKSVGASPASIQTIFVLEGMLIGFIGGLIGVVFGLAISQNIDGIFSLLELIINGLVYFAARFIAPFLGETFEEFAVFSPSYYYLTSVPSRTLFPEVLSVFLFALFSSISAAFIASRKVAEIKPFEVLRYE